MVLVLLRRPRPPQSPQDQSVKLARRAGRGSRGERLARSQGTPSRDDMCANEVCVPAGKKRFARPSALSLHMVRSNTLYPDLKSAKNASFQLTHSKLKRVAPGPRSPWSYFTNILCRIRAVHVCLICSRSFSISSNLRRHILLHST